MSASSRIERNSWTISRRSALKDAPWFWQPLATCTVMGHKLPGDLFRKRRIEPASDGRSLPVPRAVAWSSALSSLRSRSRSAHALCAMAFPVTYRHPHAPLTNPLDPESSFCLPPDLGCAASGRRKPKLRLAVRHMSQQQRVTRRQSCLRRPTYRLIRTISTTPSFSRGTDGQGRAPIVICRHVFR